MKVNIKGLVFTGFAAAILSANAMAANPASDINTVTSKSFTEATYQKKSIEPSIGGEGGVWTPLDTTVPAENASESAAPTTAAVRAAINSASQPGNFIDTQVNSSVTNKAPSDQAVYNYVGRGDFTVSINGASQTFNANQSGDTSLTVSGLEVTDNKTDDVATNSASSTKYASTKGVYDYVQAVASGIDSDMDSYQLLSEKTDNIAANATSTTAYPSAKGVADYVSSQLADTSLVGDGAFTVSINGTSQVFHANDSTDTSLTITGLEVTDNKATAIDSNNNTSTTAYPTTAAVYDYVQSVTGGTVIPRKDPSKCTDSTPCALVNEADGAHWRVMAVSANQSPAAGTLGDLTSGS